MKIKITCRPRYNPWLKKYLNTKTFSKMLAFGILINSVPINSFAGVLSDDGRYETFEGSDITINNILEEDKVDVEIEGNTLVNLATKSSGTASEQNIIKLSYPTDKSIYIQLDCTSNNMESATQLGLIIRANYSDGTSDCVGFEKDGKSTGILYIQLKNPERKNIDSILIAPHIGVTSGDAEYEDLMILEGDWTNREIPDYFEGMKSVSQDDENGHSIEIVSTNSDKTQSNKIKISLSEPLRSLPNGIKDRIIKRNGQWVVERNCVEVVLDGYRNSNLKFSPRTEINNNATMAKVGFGGEFIKDSNTSVQNDAICDNLKWIQDIPGKASETPGYSRSDTEWQIIINLPINQVGGRDFNDFNNYLKLNPISFVVERKNPIYEPLKTNSIANIFEGTTHISTNSIIPANLKVTVDRVANRAKEYSELAKINPTIENISLARMWTNLMRESILKDEFQDSVDSISEITDMTLERKTASSNIDVYIKSENMLSMNLSTNSITFDDFSGVEDMIKENAVNISINSSLPYNLNAYLATEIQNNDKSNTMNKDILSIKDNSEVDYQTFSSINDKIVLKSNCDSGNDKQHNINLKLNGGIAHEKDVYKTTIKFEAEQQ